MKVIQEENERRAREQEEKMFKYMEEQRKNGRNEIKIGRSQKRRG